MPCKNINFVMFLINIRNSFLTFVSDGQLFAVIEAPCWSTLTGKLSYVMFFYLASIARKSAM